MAIVDEPQPLVMRSCRFVPEPCLSCDFVSQYISSFHVVSNACVPWMSPTSADAGTSADVGLMMAGGSPPSSDWLASGLDLAVGPAALVGSSFSLLGLGC
jgi:hypothetical protein